MARNRELVAAIKKAQVADVQRLLAEGQDANKPDRAGNRPLHHAASTGNNDIVKILLDAGADPALPVELRTSRQVIRLEP